MCIPWRVSTHPVKADKSKIHYCLISLARAPNMARYAFTVVTWSRAIETCILLLVPGAELIAVDYEINLSPDGDLEIL